MFYRWIVGLAFSGALAAPGAGQDIYQQHLETYHQPLHRALPAPPAPRRYYLDPRPRKPITFGQPFEAQPNPPKTVRFMDESGKATTCYIYSPQTVYCY